MPGFRKGKAPKQLVEEKLDKTKVYEDVIRELLPDVYNQVVTKEKLAPIISPKVELKEAKEESDLQLVIRTCERPTVTLGDYQKTVKEGKTARHKKIWVPGQTEDTKKPEEDKGPALEEILLWVSEAITVDVPGMLLSQEVDRLLSNLIDQTKTLGLSVKQDLGATGKNAELIRQEYQEQAKKTISLEFGLDAIADKEGYFS